jgi:hypothetical protein
LAQNEPICDEILRSLANKINSSLKGFDSGKSEFLKVLTSELMPLTNSPENQEIQ